MCIATASRDFGSVRSLSLCRGANVALARATLSSLWASQIALLAARCEFAIAHTNLLALWACQIALLAARCEFAIAHTNLSALWAYQIAIIVACGVARCSFLSSRRSCAEILTSRFSLESLCRDLATETSHRDLAQRACTEIL